MKHTWILGVAVAAWPAGASSTASAQISTVTYQLDDVWLLPDLSHPGQAAQQMTGSFEWTFQEGDFENGSGQFIDLYTPWYNPGIENLNITVEVTSIEFSLIGNYHDRGLDMTLFLLEPLSPDQPATIDTVRSMFDIQYGISHKGHVVSGSIVPILDTCPADLDGDGDTDQSDLGILLSAWGIDDGGDLDSDGDTDQADLGILLADWGCGS